MKSIRICATILQKNLFPILLTFITLTVCLFSLITLFGRYQYKVYTYETYTASDLNNAIYFMASANGDPEFSTAEYRDVVAAMPGVEDVLTYQHSIIDYGVYPLNVYYLSDLMRRNFSLEVDHGRWLADKPLRTEAVIGGTVWKDMEIGSVLTLSNGVVCEVVGILPDVAIVPAFNHSTNYTCTTDIFFSATDTVIFLASPDENFPAFEEYNRRYPRNFFVTFTDECSPTQYDAVVAYLRSRGFVSDYHYIVEETEEDIREWIREQFPLPVFLLLIATINIVCICVIMVKRSMPDMAKYYLIGCTKTKSAWLITSTMAVIFSIPAVLNLLGALFAPNFLRYQLNHYIYDYRITAACVYPVVGYLGVILMIVRILPYIYYRRYSPFAFYRRFL